MDKESSTEAYIEDIPYLSRRTLLAALASGGGVVGTIFTARPSLAVSNISLAADNLSASTSDGSISAINLDGDSTATLKWENQSSPSGTVALDVKAPDNSTNSHLSTTGVWDTIVSESYSLSGDSGSVTKTFTDWFSNTSFPVSVPANHSYLSVSDFESSTEGETQKTDLKLRLRFTTTDLTAREMSTVRVSVTNSDNSPPSADFSWTKPSVDTADFTDESSDPDNNIESYYWDFGDGTTSTAQNPTHDFGNTGDLSVGLTVTDTEGASDTATKTVSISELLFEGFEGDLSAWDGFKGWLSLNTGTVWEGNQSLMTNPEREGDYAYSMPSDSLRFYPTAGDKFAYRIYPGDAGSGNGSHVFAFGFQDDDNHYKIVVNVWNGSFNLGKIENGSGTTLDSYATGFSEQWYRVVTDWAKNGTLTVDLYDQNGTHITQLQGSDSTWTGGGIGMKAQSGAWAYWDDFNLLDVTPTARFQTTFNGLDVTFSDASYGFDSPIDTWNWDFGDGGTSTAENPTHTYASGDDYTVSLTATSEDGVSHTVSQTLTALKSPTLIGSLEDGDISGWGGNTGAYSTSSNHSVDGSYSAFTNPSFNNVALLEKNETVAQGDRFTGWVRADNNVHFLYGAPSVSGAGSYDGYGVQVQPNNDYVLLARWDGGSKTTLHKINTNVSAWKWHRIHIKWDTDGTHTATITFNNGEEVAQLTATDSTYTSGHVGMMGYNAKAWGDYWRKNVKL